MDLIFINLKGIDYYELFKYNFEKDISDLELRLIASQLKIPNSITETINKDSFFQFLEGTGSVDRNELSALKNALETLSLKKYIKIVDDYQEPKKHKSEFTDDE